MLGKLIKHEFKTTGRYIVMVFAILAIITPISALYLKFSDKYFIELAEGNSGLQVFNGILTFFFGSIYGLVLFAVCMVTFVVLLFRFYKSMVSTESYLTHTLPVNTSSLLISKGLVALAWTLVSILLLIISLLVFTKILFEWNTQDFLKELQNFYDAFKVEGFSTLHLILLGVTFILGIISNITMFGASFAIGHRLNGHPILGTIIAYIAIYMSLQIVSSVVMALLQVFDVFSLTGVNASGAFMIFCFIMIAYSVVTSVAFYLTALHFFKNKLNI